MLILDFINVGYGDAILLRDTAAGSAVLVDVGDVSVGDGGPGAKRISAAAFLRQERVEAIDLLVLTHLHLDHVGGLREVLAHTRVRALLTNYLPPRAAWGTRVASPNGCSSGAACLIEALNIYLESLQLLARSGASIALAQPGGRLLAPGLYAEIEMETPAVYRRQEAIWAHALAGQPDGAELDELDRFINDTSIRLRLARDGHTLLLPGDYSAAAWEKQDIRPCELVKLPHHGHADSVTQSILDRLRPRTAVISVSNTRRDDCPAASVLALLQKNGVEVQTTDAVLLPGHAPEYRESIRFLW